MKVIHLESQQNLNTNQVGIYLQVLELKKNYTKYK